ncbi:MAG: caspase family protein [Bacteroidetes bacterium]|nr:caspase family protein [Bacteroidota bacterium]MBU1717821.1 caspase family protein [Bacteroidota bacterium]
MKRIIWIIKCLQLLTISLLFSTVITAQNSSSAAKLFEEASAEFDNNNFTKSLSLISQAKKAESKSGETDSVFYAGLLTLEGRVYMFSERYREAAFLFLDAACLYYRNGKNEDAKTMYSRAIYSCEQASVFDKELKTSFSDKTRNVFFRVNEVKYNENGEPVAGLDAGTNFGINTVKSGNYYAPELPDANRESANYAGKATVISQTFSSTQCVVSFFSEFQDSLRVGDMIELECKMPENSHVSELSKVAALGIFLLDNSKSSFSSQYLWLSYSDPTLSEMVFDFSVTDVKKTADMVRDLEVPDLIKPIPDGNYPDSSVMYMMENCTQQDVASFFNFMISFPGKYIGKDWKLNEIIATWFLNSSPSGDFDEYLSQRTLSLANDSLIKFAQANHFYLKETVLSTWPEKIQAHFDNTSPDSAEQMIVTGLEISNTLGLDSLRDVYTELLASLRSSQNRYNDATVLLNEMLLRNPDALNPLFMRSYALSQMGKLAEAMTDLGRLIMLLPDYAPAYGNLGWYQLLSGNIFDARKSCQKSWDMDSSSYSSAMNLGHTYLLLGDMEHAAQYYRKSMDMMVETRGYTEGLLADLDTFALKGWQPEMIKSAKAFVEKEYNEKYKYSINAEEAFSSGLVLKNKKQYAEAIVEFLKAEENEVKSPDTDTLTVFRCHTWLGYCEHLLGNIDKAIEYYEKSLVIAVHQLQDESHIANAYDLLSWGHRDAGNAVVADSYVELWNSLNRKTNEESEIPKVYAIIVGKNQAGHGNYGFASDDAGAFADSLLKFAGMVYDSVRLTLLTDDLVTREQVEAAFKKVFRSSKAADIFIFYFAGNADTLAGEPGLMLETGEKPVFLGANLLKTWFTTIPARKQFIAFDASAAKVMDHIVGQIVSNYDPMIFSDRSFFILCPSGSRTEDIERKHGILTTNLLEGISGHGHTGFVEGAVISAKDVESYVFSRMSRSSPYLSVKSYAFGRDFILSGTSEDMRYQQFAMTKNTGKQEEHQDEQAEFGVGQRKDHALLVGINNYDEFGDLVNPISDVEAIAKDLTELYGFEVEVITDVTKLEIKAKIREYQQKQFGPHDQLLIYFAGHGLYDEISGEGFLVTKDSKEEDEVKDTYIEYSWLRENINGIRNCNHILLALDVCFGGTFDKRTAYARRGGDDVYGQISADDFIDRTLKYKSRLFLTSGSKEYVSDGIPGKNSPFTYYILDALRNESKESGYMTFMNLVKSVERLQTTPRYGDFGDSEAGGDFVFVVKRQAVMAIRKDKMK